LTSKPPVAGFVVLVNNSLRASPKARAKFTEGATIGHQYATLEGGEKRVSDHQTEVSLAGKRYRPGRVHNRITTTVS